jgi:hypothetical protein
MTELPAIACNLLQATVCLCTVSASIALCQIFYIFIVHHFYGCFLNLLSNWELSDVLSQSVMRTQSE